MVEGNSDKGENGDFLNDQNGDGEDESTFSDTFASAVEAVDDFWEEENLETDVDRKLDMGVEIDVDGSEEFSDRLVSVVDALKGSDPGSADKRKKGESVDDVSGNLPASSFKVFCHMVDVSISEMGFSRRDSTDMGDKNISRYKSPDRIQRFDEVIVVMEKKGEKVRVRLVSEEDEIDYSGKANLSDYIKVVDGEAKGTNTETLKKNLRKAFEPYL